MRLTVTNPATWGLPGPWSEDDLAMAIATELRRLEWETQRFTFAHDQNGVKRSRASGGRAKAMGMRAGEPDLRVYLTGGRIGHIELKTAKGTASAEQRERHRTLRNLGHDVRVVKAATPREAVDQTISIVKEWIHE